MPKVPINITANKYFSDGILPHISHSLFRKLNKSANFLQVSPRKIENVISGGLQREREDGKIFRKKLARGHFFGIQEYVVFADKLYSMKYNEKPVQNTTVPKVTISYLWAPCHASSYDSHEMFRVFRGAVPQDEHWPRIDHDHAPSQFQHI